MSKEGTWETRPSSEPEVSWNDLDWSRPSLAVIASDGEGNGCVVYVRP